MHNSPFLLNSVGVDFDIRRGAHDHRDVRHQRGGPGMPQQRVLPGPVYQHRRPHDLPGRPHVSPQPHRLLTSDQVSTAAATSSAARGIASRQRIQRRRWHHGRPPAPLQRRELRAGVGGGSRCVSPGGRQRFTSYLPRKLRPEMTGEGGDMPACEEQQQEGRGVGRNGCSDRCSVLAMYL